MKTPTSDRRSLGIKLVAMTVTMTMAWAVVLAACLIAGCNRGGGGGGAIGPATTRTTSAKFATTAERANFLNQYVTFRQTYDSLDFDIAYQNNEGGMVPGPSDWDVRLVATVPEPELQAWVPQGLTPTPTAPDLAWLGSVPTQKNPSGITEWYVDGHRMIGIDRVRRVVVYRAWSS